jgi:hypothetical protein
LKSGIGHGLLDGYWNLSAAQIRRIACDAAVVPVVLGSKSEILDIGRATRIVPRAIRRALIRRDKGCSFPGCAKMAIPGQALQHACPGLDAAQLGGSIAASTSGE